MRADGVVGQMQNRSKVIDCAVFRPQQSEDLAARTF